jgi:small subunit ribosomal protein S18
MFASGLLDRCRTDREHEESNMARRKSSPLKKGEVVDYKDVRRLQRFLTERGKILPRRATGLTAKQQRMIARAIKRSRQIALLPYVKRD